MCFNVSLAVPISKIYINQLCERTSEIVGKRVFAQY